MTRGGNDKTQTTPSGFVSPLQTFSLLRCLACKHEGRMIEALAKEQRQVIARGEVTLGGRSWS